MEFGAQNFGIFGIYLILKMKEILDGGLHPLDNLMWIQCGWLIRNA